jgi:hypothetical protein
VTAATAATCFAPGNLHMNDADLEPVLPDGLRPLFPDGSFEKTRAALRSNSPAFLREFRKIFSLPRFEEIFNGRFERAPG